MNYENRVVDCKDRIGHAETAVQERERVSEIKLPPISEA